MSPSYSDLSPQEKAARASVEVRRQRAEDRRARLRRHAIRALESGPIALGTPLELIVLRPDDPNVASAELAAIVSTLVRDGIILRHGVTLELVLTRAQARVILAELGVDDRELEGAELIAAAIAAAQETNVK